MFALEEIFSKDPFSKVSAHMVWSELIGCCNARYVVTEQKHHMYVKYIQSCLECLQGPWKSQDLSLSISLSFLPSPLRSSSSSLPEVYFCAHSLSPSLYLSFFPRFLSWMSLFPFGCHCFCFLFFPFSRSFCPHHSHKLFHIFPLVSAFPFVPGFLFFSLRLSSSASFHLFLLVPLVNFLFLSSSPFPNFVKICFPFSVKRPPSLSLARVLVDLEVQEKMKSNRGIVLHVLQPL